MPNTQWRNIFFNVLVVCAAIIVAVTPVLMLLWSLNNYAEQRAQASLSDIAGRLLAHTDNVLNESVDALASLSTVVRQTCNDTAKAQMEALISQATYMRDILAVSPQGGVICSTSSAALKHQLAPAFRTARSKSIGLAYVPAKTGQGQVQIRWQEGMNTLYAFFNPYSLRLNILPNEWHGEAKGSVSLDDNTLVANVDAQNNRSFREGEKIFSAQRSSQRFPIKVDVAVSRNVAVAPYKAVSMLIGVGGSMLAIMLIVFVMQSVRRRPQAEDAIAAGIRNKEFVPFYQPVVNLQTGELLGCEVLIRWLRKDGSVIPPGAFIQLAEESGLALEMTRQLMTQVREGLSKAYAERPQLKVAFNLFAAHFSDLSTVDDVREIFKTGGIRYSQIVLEVTERYPLPNLNRARAAIGALQNLGCRVALDDAGTGHGGLAYLQKLGMDQVKIDKLFVDTITEGVTASPIIDSLIAMARQMNMEIVAEGVETLTQSDYLKSHGVVAAQGYLFAKPMPQRDYLRFIDTMAPLKTSSANIVYLDVA